MILDDETQLLGDFFLTLFYFRIVEFLDVATIDADDMVVMRTFVQLEHGLAGFEVVALQQPRLLELRKHAIYRREAHLGVFDQQ